MFEFGSFELGPAKWAVMALCGFLVGIAKTGIPGFGILVVPLAALVLPTKASVGVVLPMLIFADLFSAGYYHRKAQWRHVGLLMPSSLLGIVVGAQFMERIHSDQLGPIIGIIVLVMIGLQAWNNTRKKPYVLKTAWSRWLFVALMGFCAGVTTMMANAAGPVMIIYLLAAGLPKIEFVGTAAWYFFIVNWLKVPFHSKLDLINAESLKLDLSLFPFIVVGAVTGIIVLKYIPQKAFRIVVTVLAAAAAIKLLF